MEAVTRKPVVRCGMSWNGDFWNMYLDSRAALSEIRSQLNPKFGLNSGDFAVTDDLRDALRPAPGALCPRSVPLRPTNAPRLPGRVSLQSTN